LGSKPKIRTGNIFPEAKAEDLASETKAKVKDLTLETKAKDIIGWPRGASALESKATSSRTPTLTPSPL